MNKIVIDKEKCIGCGACVKDCPAFSLSVKNGKAEKIGEACIECGHCYSICPVNAVQMAGYECADEKITPMTDIDPELLLNAMKSRRTVRQFKNQKIEQDKIDKILEAGRYCPTGGNSQHVAYTILDTKQDEFESLCVKTFRKGVNIGSKFSKLLGNMKIDDDFFFKKAPLVIVVSSRDNVNASLASSYMEIMAESLGLGVLYSGFFVACAKINPKIKSMLNLKKGYKVCTCMVIGYPDVKYYRVAPRKELKVNKL